MKLSEYFEQAKGVGVLATADANGKVNVAIFARPHFMDENDDSTCAFIMGDRASHDNVRQNPSAAYLFIEVGEEYVGKRLSLTMLQEETDAEKIQVALEQVQEKMDQEHVRISQNATTASVKYIGAATEIGVLATRTELAATEIGVVASSGSRFFTRATSTAMKSAKFARFAGGFLSAATIAIEAKDMHATIQKIRSGSPCDKAEMLRNIQEEVGAFPETNDVHQKCEKYFATLAKRRKEEESVHSEMGCGSSMYVEVAQCLFNDK